MSTPPIDRLEIEVGNFPLDSSFIEHNGTYTLFLRPQTFSSAVRHVRNVLPHITLEAAESMVREQCPEFKDFDELFGVSTPSVPSIERPADTLAKDDAGPVRRKRRRQAVLVAALLPALAASWAVGRYTNVADSTDRDTNATAADTAAHTASPDSAAPDASQAPFSDKRFEFFAGSSKIACDPISTLQAECTDADGVVMSTKAATGPDSTIFTFSYGSERIGLRIFYDAEYAETWAGQDGSRELYPHMRVHGRYVLWGTDPGRIKEYADLLVEADHQAGPKALGGATPLPPRLAALALGTLGLDSHEVNQIIARPAVAVTDAPAMVAARLVLGLDPAPAGIVHEGDDIVALAAGIEPNPPAVAPGPVVVPVTDTGSGTDTTPPAAPAEEDAPLPTAPSTGTKPPAESAPPSAPAPADPKPSAPPAAAPEPQNPAPQQPTPPKAPAEEAPKPPAQETPPASPEPPAEETSAPVEEPPAEESPALPAEEPSPADASAPGDSTDTGEGEGGDDLLIVSFAWTVAS